MRPPSCWSHKGRTKAKLHRSILRIRSNNNMRKSNTQPAWKILAPIDLSINAEGPVAHATNIALAMGAELTLLYVVDQRCNSWRGRLRWPSNALNDVLADCAVHRLILPAGNPAETIARYAEFINADLLAMTSEHYGKWSRFWKHSVTRDVMRWTKRPVCVTDLRSADADYRFRCRRILCMLTLDGTDDQLLLHVQVLAQRSASDLMERFVPLEDFGRESFSASPRAWSTPASTYWLKPSSEVLKNLVA